MKNTKITAVFVIRNVEDVAQTTNNLVNEFKDCGLDMETHFTTTLDDDSVKFEFGRSKGRSEMFSFNDVATFLEKYATNISKYDIIRSLIDYHSIETIDIETVNVSDEGDHDEG